MATVQTKISCRADSSTTRGTGHDGGGIFSFIHLDDAAGAVQVQLWLEHLGTTSVVYGFRVLSNDGTVVHAEGRRVQVRLDPATLRPAPIGAELREACRPLLAQGECAPECEAGASPHIPRGCVVELMRRTHHPASRKLSDIVTACPACDRAWPAP